MLKIAGAACALISTLILVTICSDLIWVGTGEISIDESRDGTPTANATPTDVVEIFPDCGWDAVGQAFVDENGDGTRNANEPPLTGVRFFVDDTLNGYTDVGREATSNEDGTAPLFVWLPGCPKVALEVYSQAPDGFTLTTPERLKAGDSIPRIFEFGFTHGK